MKRATAAAMWSDEDGGLSWEWVMITTLIVLGIVGGVSAARDAAIDELGDISQAFLAVDQSYAIDFPLEITIDGESMEGGTNSTFTDAAVYSDCTRVVSPLGQGAESDL